MWDSDGSHYYWDGKLGFWEGQIAVLRCPDRKGGSRKVIYDPYEASVRYLHLWGTTAPLKIV